MIGTKVVVGYDQNAVVKGLKGTEGLFKNAFKQIGIGAARQVGYGITNMLGKIASALPTVTVNALNFGESLFEMSEQTGISIGKLLELQEALRMSGVDMSDPAKAISTFSKNLFEATQGPGVRDLLEKLFGKSDIARELYKMKPDEAIYKITEKVGDALRSGLMKEGEASNIFTGLFPAKQGGFDFVKFAKNYSESMAQARQHMASQIPLWERLAKRADAFNDALGRGKNAANALGGIILERIINITEKGGGLDKLFDFFDPMKQESNINALFDMIEARIRELANGDIKVMFSNISRDLGKAFGEGVRSEMNPFKPAMDSVYNAGGALASHPALSPTSLGLASAPVKAMLPMVGIIEAAFKIYERNQIQQLKKTDEGNAYLKASLRDKYSTFAP
jgi:hypothetical protein